MNRTYGIEESHSRVVVHILSAINETTGGYQDFAVWRAKHIKQEKNIVFVCGRRRDGNKKDLSGIEIVWGTRDIKRIRKKMKEICSICHKKGIPIVFHIQHTGVIIDIMRACAGLNIRKHTVYTQKNTFASYADTVKRNCVLAALYAKHLTFLSYASYDAYPRLVKMLKHGNISVIEYGACQDGIKKIDWTKREYKVKPILELIYTARFVPVKNHMFLVDVIDQLDGVHLTFVGGGEQASAIQSEIRKRHLENKIIITGLVSREKLYEILEQGDIYISSSTYEGMPMSVLEAMHTGLPIILSDIKPHVELAKQSDGIEILPLKKELWVDKLNCMRQLKTEELAKMGEENADAAKRLFTLDRMHRRYDRLYSLLE